MHKQFYFLSPVEVVKVTPQNMEEVAEWCGGKVSQIESKRNPGKMDKYVDVPMPKESNQSAAYPGMYVTKRMVIKADNELKVTYAVFRKDYFDKNYFDNPILAVDMTWERKVREDAAALERSPVAAAFKRAEERAKPTAPKQKVVKEQTLKELTESQRLEEAIQTVQDIIPGAVVITGDALHVDGVKSVPSENFFEQKEEVDLILVQANELVDPEEKNVAPPTPEELSAAFIDVTSDNAADILPAYKDVDQILGGEVTQITKFEAEYGRNIGLAKKFVGDVFKAPEVRAMADAFLATCTAEELAPYNA